MIVDKDGEVVAEGQNLVNTSVDITAHGEMTAIRNACKALNRVRGVDLLQLRTVRHVHLGALTCEHCESLLRDEIVCLA